MLTPQKPLLITAALGWGLAILFYFKPSPRSEPQLVEKEVVKYVDRVVTKNVVRTVTKPDGTKIVTETKSKEASKETAKEVSKTEYAKLLPVYSLGVSARFDNLGPPSSYPIDLGYRIGQSPLWVTGGLSVTPKFKVDSAQVGLRLEF